MAQSASAEGCLPPARPYLPNDSATILEYQDILRADFESYLANVLSYFRCLEEERGRVFVEAREVLLEYGRFLEQTNKD